MDKPNLNFDKNKVLELCEKKKALCLKKIEEYKNKATTWEEFRSEIEKL